MSQRSLLLSGVFVGAAAGLATAIVYRARCINPYSPRLEQLNLTLPAGHAGLAGLRIGFISDTHVGPFFSADDLARATKLLADAGPDLILFGGDYISEAPRHIEPTAKVLGELAARARLGGIAVLGNHDYANGAERVTAALEQAGITVLQNEARAVDTGQGTLWIAGIEEALLAKSDPATTFKQIPPGAAVLVLWHEPAFAGRIAHYGAFAQLSGHSHGGQVRLPVIGALGLPPYGSPHVIGLSNADGMPVYTSRGVGVYRPPVRLNCPPEVTLFTLTNAT